MLCYKFETDFGGSKGVSFVYHSPHIYDYLAIASLLSMFVLFALAFNKRLNGKYIAIGICIGLFLVIVKSQYICNIHNSFISKFLFLELFMFWPLLVVTMFWTANSCFGNKITKYAVAITFISTAIIYFTSTILL